MDSKKILIIDDDDDLSLIISDMLTSYGYDVTCAHDADEAFGLLSRQAFQLLLLDINLPGITGFELCRELRRVSTVPVIFASARTSENDRIIGLDIGGDDYLSKPYSMKELLAHVNAIVRRTYGFGGTEQDSRFGNVTIKTASRIVEKEGRQISLSLREFDLLIYLVNHKNQAIPKDKLINEVWGAFSGVEPATLTVHIRWLREKLEDDPAKPVHIKTVWGVGYMLEDTICAEAAQKCGNHEE